MTSKRCHEIVLLDCSLVVWHHGEEAAELQCLELQQSSHFSTGSELQGKLSSRLGSHDV